MHKRHLFQIAVSVFTIILMGFSAWAVPQTINYQGKLTDPNGVSIAGSHILEFYLYTEEQGGSDLWTEQQTVQLIEGIYNVQLGSVKPFPNNLFDNDPLYLEVKIFRSPTGWETLSPRQPLTSTPFAIKAGDSDTLDGYDSTDLAATNHTHNGEDITSGIIDDTYIDQAITRDSELDTHKADPSVHHTKTTSFTELIDTATDDQIPDDITVNYAKDADKVDGKHASEFGDGHSLDAADGAPLNAVYVDTNGNVGIGTTSPTEALDVYGNAKATSFVGDGSGLSGIIKIESDPLFTAWDKSTGITITENQITNLDHFTNADETDPVFGASAASGITSSDINNWDNAYSWGDHSTAGYDTTNDSWTGTGDVYTTSGNIGIGTSSPRYILHIVKHQNKKTNVVISNTDIGNSACVNLLVTAGNQNYLQSNIYASGYGYITGGASVSLMYGNTANAPVGFMTNYIERLRIDSSGNVGIGTTSPASKLDVNGTVTAGAIFGQWAKLEGPTPLFRIKNASGLPNSRAFQMQVVGDRLHIGTSNDDWSWKEDSVLVLTHSGNVGIGTGSPQGKLDVNGTIYQRGRELHADYVFEPDYKLESIEEHAKFMWKEKHLKAIPKAKEDKDGKEIIEVGAHSKGILEELEKAHIYIEQLHKRISELTTRIEALESNN